MHKFLLFFLLCLFCLCSCSVSERVSYGDSEGALPEDIIKKIKSKKAEKSWIIANLGEPFSIDSVESTSATSLSGYEVYNYRFEKTHIRTGHLLFVLRSGGREDAVEYFHIAFEGNTVEKAWIDNLPNAPLKKRVEKLAKNAVEPRKKADMPKIVDNDNRFAWKLPILKKWFSKPVEQEKNTDAVAAQPSESTPKNMSVDEVMPPKNLASPAKQEQQGQDSSDTAVNEVMLSEPQ